MASSCGRASGTRNAYRQVRWTPKQCEKANVTANKLGGGWDFDVLANEFDVGDLLEWGFKGWEIGIPDGVDVDAEWQAMPEFEQEDMSGAQSIHVHFATREDVNAFAELIGQTLTEETRAIWYPMADKIDMISELYADGA